jgi:ABC-type uncharacterized transport system permease subunit
MFHQLEYFIAFSRCFIPMKSLLLATLAAYTVAAIHAVLAFINKRRNVERVSFAALAFGFVLHTTALVSDWVQDGQYPLAFTHETLSFLAWAMVIAYALALYRYNARAFGAFTLPIVALLVVASAVVRDAASPRAVSGGASAWLFPVHTTLLFFAYTAFFIVFAASVMYLWQERELKLKTFSAFFHRLPSLTTVDDIGTTAATVGFTLLSLGIITGMLYSSARNGRIWHNDPIEIAALLTWILYLALIHFREQWRGRKAAWIGIVGFAIILSTVVTALVMGSYHFFG